AGPPIGRATNRTDHGGHKMDFGVSDEQREFRELCRRFAAEVIRPAAPAHDADESTPWEVIKAAREWGLEGIDHIQRLAGDPDGQFSVIYAEELHWGCAGSALALSGWSLAARGASGIRRCARRGWRRRALRSRSQSGFPSASGSGTRSSSAPMRSPSPK